MKKPPDLTGTLIAAVPVPFDSGGRIERGAQRAYVEHLARQPVDGVAVWAHTGRGLRLDRAQRAEVLNDWREAFGGARPLIAAAGAAPGLNDWDEALASARDMAEHAAELGADALLVHPPVIVRGAPDPDPRIVEYHDAIARAGLPLILFYLYEAAGGVSYSRAVLSELLARPEVIGIKVATLDSVMTYQEIARLVTERFPEKLLITGEDRFLGYSLECGARAALIGMAAACSRIQADLLRAHRDGQAARFLALSRQVDRLAQATFIAPMEGYIQRMLWCVVHEGVVPRTAAHDPWGPAVPEAEFASLRTLVLELGRYAR